MADAEWEVVFEAVHHSAADRAFHLLADEGFTARTRRVEGLDVSTGFVQDHQVLTLSAEVDQARETLDLYGFTLQDYTPMPPSSIADAASDDTRSGAVTVAMLFAVMIALAIILLWSI